jgi:methyl-accepting chemotaxis protein
MEMFKGLKLQTKIMLGSCLPLILVVIFGSVCGAGVSSLLDSSHWVDHTHNVIETAQQIEGAAVDMETGMRGYLLAGEEGFLDPYKSGQKRFHELISELKNTVSDNPAQVQLLNETKDNIDAWISDVVEPTIELRRDIGDSKTMDDMADFVGEARGKKYFDKFRGQIAAFVDVEESLLKKRKSGAQSADAGDWVEHTYEVIQVAMKIEGAAVDMETGMRGYLLAGDEGFLAPYESGKDRFYSLVSSLSKTVDDNPAQVQRLSAIKENITAWRDDVVEPTIDLRRDIGDAKTMNDMAALVGEARGKKYFDKFRGQIKTFIERESALMATRKVKAKQTATAVIQSVLWGTILTIVIAIVGSFFIARGIASKIDVIIKQLSVGSDELASVTGQVSSASQSLAEGATEQAAGLEQTSSSLEEMSSMTKQSAANAQQTNVLATEARNAAESGNLAMGRMSSAINDIQQSSTETAKIIKVIDEIAFQTNLLALNAAVEAARAGEAGKGFAVVAEEVRNLAKRSAEAAKDTSELIDGAVKNAQNGVEITAEVGESLQGIVTNITKTSELVSEIAAAAEEQSQGIGQVNSAITQMDQVTQANAANAEESASASEELSSQVHQMNDIVKELSQLVDGGSGGQALVSSRSASRRPALAHSSPSRGTVPSNQIIPFDEDMGSFNM